MKNIYFIIAIILGAVNLFYSYSIEKKQAKVVYADAIKLFSEFDLKKEMEQKYDSELIFLKNRIDSLETIFNLSQGENKIVKKQIEETSLVLEAKFKEARDDINKTGWNRLNTLINQYGKEMHFDIIIGGNGMGSLLYGSNKWDVTNELINYVNLKYHGK